MAPAGTIKYDESSAIERRLDALASLTIFFIAATLFGENQAAIAQSPNSYPWWAKCEKECNGTATRSG